MANEAYKSDLVIFWHGTDMPPFPLCCRYWGVVSTGRRNTGDQLAINNDDGLPNARPMAVGAPLATNYPTTPFSLPHSHQHEVTDLSSYTLNLFPLR
jgi:hypothetical protein